MKVFSALLIVVGLINPVYAQSLKNTQSLKRDITLEDIWARYLFYPTSFDAPNWMANGQYYTAAQQSVIYKYKTTTGEQLEMIADPGIPFQSYVLNTQEDKLLLLTENESIYRRSFKGNYYIYDIAQKKLSELSKGGKQSYATISPDGSRVAFVRENNLYMVDLVTMQETAITTTGRRNAIIHGSTDWVYEEEFGFVQAFFWSPDGQKIAFYTFDETRVKEYNMQKWGEIYPYDYRFKYPKAGEENAKVSLSVYHLSSGQTIPIILEQTEKDFYIPRVSWTKNPDLLSIRKLNRLQNRLELLHADVHTGQTTPILIEESKTYVDIEFNEELFYLSEGKGFIYTSEKNGFKHLYLHKMDGKSSKQITKGDWEVSKVEGIDEENELIYFTSTQDSPLERHLYAINFKGGKPKKITSSSGWHSIKMSKDCQYYIDEYSTANTPPIHALYQNTGILVKVLEKNEDLKEKLKNYKLSPKEFFNFLSKDGTLLNGWMIKPQSFDSTKTYPVLMFVYGGPGSQEVTNQWDVFDYFWYQILAEKGYIVACIDNRGTGGRGAEFRKSTYKQLGKLEVQDQIQAALYLKSLPYIDKNRIGIWGWSYGGYMAANCILQGADVFKTAIAVAPVANWRFYDSIYTERYLQTPQLNPKGYDDNSPLNHVHKLKGNFLLIHGTADDNVHFQNTLELQEALIKAGKQFDTFIYPNKNHGIYGGSTRLHLYELMTSFLLEKL